MFTLVSNFIGDRLRKIQFAGTPITVYPYIPSREKGRTKRPCYGYKRLYWKPDLERARPNVEQFTPSEETETIHYTPVQAMGGPQDVTGPVSWKRKPFPVPVKMVYEIQAQATKEAHANALAAYLIQAFPTGYMPLIGDQHPLITLGNPSNHDELDKPLYMASALLFVEEVWIDRIEEYGNAPLTDPDIDIGTFT